MQFTIHRLQHVQEFIYAFFLLWSVEMAKGSVGSTCYHKTMAVCSAVNGKDLIAGQYYLLLVNNKYFGNFIHTTNEKEVQSSICSFRKSVGDLRMSNVRTLDNEIITECVTILCH